MTTGDGPRHSLPGGAVDRGGAAQRPPHPGAVGGHRVVLPRDQHQLRRPRQPLGRAPFISREFSLGPEQMGLILGAFIWTYAIFHLPAGWFIDKLGPRIMYAFAVAWWSVFTALSAVASGFTSLFGYRLGLGVGESAAYPANAKVVSRWFPIRERAFATSIYDSGARVGTAVSIPLVAFIIAGLGRRASFVITGVIGFIWVVVWFLYYRDPHEHRRVSAEEIAYIEADHDRPEHQPGGATPAPSISRSDLFRYRTIWGMTLGFFCLSLVIYFFITWIPTYLIQARHFTLLSFGIYGEIPALVAIVGGWAGGLYSDRLLRRGASLTKARKVCLVGGCARLLPGRRLPPRRGQRGRRGAAARGQVRRSGVPPRGRRRAVRARAAPQRLRLHRGVRQPRRRRGRIRRPPPRTLPRPGADIRRALPATRTTRLQRPDAL